MEVVYRHIADVAIDDVLRFLARYDPTWRPVSEATFRSEFSFRPRWCDAIVAMNEASCEILGYICYSVCSSAFIGGNDYYVMQLVLAPGENQSEIFAELVRQSEADDDW